MELGKKDKLPNLCKAKEEWELGVIPGIEITVEPCPETDIVKVAEFGLGVRAKSDDLMVTFEARSIFGKLNP